MSRITQIFTLYTFSQSSLRSWRLQVDAGVPAEDRFLDPILFGYIFKEPELIPHNAAC